MKRPVLLTSLAGAALLSGLLLIDRAPLTGAGGDWRQSEQTRLENALRHAAPGSDRAFKTQMKLDRLRAYEQGLPQPGFPDEFAKVLYEMRIPSDRTAPDYAPGYQTRELAKTPKRPHADKTLTWASRGPGNVSGRARGIIVDPDDPTGLTWFIAAVGGGVWKTDDGGANWRELTDEVPYLAVQSLAMAASDHDVIYAGTGESFFNIDTMNGNGILKSVDRGETWTLLSSTSGDPRFNNVSRIIVSPTDPNLVVASATTGAYKAYLYPTSSIFRSTDGGATWTEVHIEAVNRILQVLADPTDFAIQYATVRSGGVLKSTDAGLNWYESNGGILDFTGRFELAVSPVDHNYLFASAEGASHSELWVSWDAGVTWNETFEAGTEPSWLGAQGWYDNTIVCDPDIPTIVYVGGPELWSISLAAIGSQSRTSARLASYSFPHPDHHGLEIVHPSGGGWFLLGTNDGGITRTAGGATGFSMPILGMTTTQFYGVDKRPGASAYVGGMQDNGTWRSPVDPVGTTPWYDQIGGDGYETSWHFDDPLKIMGGYQYNGLQRSVDGGLTWSSATSGLTDLGSAKAPFITKIGKSQARPDVVFAVGKAGVWRSTNFGASWTLSTVNAADWGALTSFQDVEVSEADPDVVWAGSRMDVDGSIVVSTNGGVSFSGTTDYTTATMGRISGMAAHPTQPNTAYVLFSYAERPKILKTTDLGATWTDISGFGAGSVSTNGFPDVAVYDLLVWPNDINKIWVGTEIGLVESLDGGATWALANNGLPAVGIWFLTAVEDEVVVGTHGRGIWTTSDLALEAGQVYKPLLENLYQPPSGEMIVELNLRSEYDSTQVWVDGVKLQTFGPNTRRQLESVSVPVVATATRSVFARAFKAGTPYDSVTRQVQVYALGVPVFDYASSLSSGADLAMTLFSIQTPAGFSNPALHTNHFYADNTTPVALLTVPIKVGNPSTLSFDEIAIVEPGDTGTVFGDSGFWDYVIVEGSLDGVTWTPLADGWDCRDDPDWLDAFNLGQSGNSSLYRPRSISMNDAFAFGDVVLVRFRLYADASVNGWGWAIDNLNIVSQGVSPVGDTPRAVTLAQNYPNPFNPATTIAFDLPARGPVKLQIFDPRGRLVRTLVDEVRAEGEHRVTWDGRDDRDRTSAAGVYLYRLTAGGTVRQEKMTLIK